MHKWIMVSGAGFAMLSVILGAFAAHGLKTRISEYSIGIFQTGVQYQSIHGIGLILCGFFALHLKSQNTPINIWVNWCAIMFILGIICFSGSLYGLALTGQKWFGPITPIGGLLFIAGWICFIISIARS